MTRNPCVGIAFLLTAVFCLSGCCAPAWAQETLSPETAARDLAAGGIAQGRGRRSRRVDPLDSRRCAGTDRRGRAADGSGIGCAAPGRAARGAGRGRGGRTRCNGGNPDLHQPFGAGGELAAMGARRREDRRAAAAARRLGGWAACHGQAHWRPPRRGGGRGCDRPPPVPPVRSRTGTRRGRGAGRGAAPAGAGAARATPRRRTTGLAETSASRRRSKPSPTRAPSAGTSRAGISDGCGERTGHDGTNRSSPRPRGDRPGPRDPGDAAADVDRHVRAGLPDAVGGLRHGSTRGPPDRTIRRRRRAPSAMLAMRRRGRSRGIRPTRSTCRAMRARTCRSGTSVRAASWTRAGRGSPIRTTPEARPAGR